MARYLFTIFWFDSLLRTILAQRHVEIFPFSNGWQGADAAYSIRLDAASGRYLWLFGDTFVGPPQDTARRHLYGMPKNSVAIVHCAVGAAGQCTAPQYFWNNMGTVWARAFFDTYLNTEWFWPLDGFVWRQKLFLFLGRHRSTQDKPVGFNFELMRVELAVIDNYETSPSQWHIRYQTIATGPIVMPGTSVVIGQDGFLYCFTAIHSGSTEFTTLLRLPLSLVTGASIPPIGQGHWQYLATNGVWHPMGQQPPGILVHSAKQVNQIFPRGYTEFTVRYHPSKNMWIAIMPGLIIEASVLYSQARALEGPWTRPAMLWRYAEMQPGNPDYTSNVLCYAAKEHPELESVGQLTFSYVCNSAREPETRGNTHLYRPQLVTVPMPVL